MFKEIHKNWAFSLINKMANKDGLFLKPRMARWTLLVCQHFKSDHSQELYQWGQFTLSKLGFSQKRSYLHGPIRLVLLGNFSIKRPKF